MDAFLALCMFIGAWKINGQTFKGSGIIAVLIGFGGSMLLYRSPTSQTILNWLNDNIMGAMTGAIGASLNDPLPPSVVWAVLCIAGFVVTIFDLWKNHQYNAWAIAALVITPIAAHGAGSGWVPWVIDAIHTFGAGVVGFIIGGSIAGGAGAF